MVDRGAVGTDEQFARILNYLQRTLTIVNVNSASAPQLAPVLGVSEQTAEAIVASAAARGDSPILPNSSAFPASTLRD